MTLGEKIKSLRKKSRITQAELTKGKITRNMLSAIESDKASPSLDTLLFIAKRLGVAPSYFLSEDEDLLFFEKKACIGEIRNFYSEKKYKACINKIVHLDGTDDELDYILACCYFELGKKAVLGGSLKSGKEYLELADLHSKNTVYDTSKIQTASLIYTALTKNIQSPLLELDSAAFESGINSEFEYDFYKYLVGDINFKQKNPIFEKHIKAKDLMKERKYKDALLLMRSIEDGKTPESYNAYVIFAVYTDMENCYKQLLDYENAYRYASKRLSIIEGFKL